MSTVHSLGAWSLGPSQWVLGGKLPKMQMIDIARSISVQQGCLRNFIIGFCMSSGSAHALQLIISITSSPEGGQGESDVGSLLAGNLGDSER